MFSGDRSDQLSLQALVLGLQLFLGFVPGRIERNAADRADLLALRLIEMAHAFSAFMRVDFVNQRPHVNRTVRALRLAYVAINTVVGDQ